MLLLIPLGVICEMQSGFLFTAVVFEVGIFAGTLGFNRYQPYLQLVGCSHGVLGILGGSFANCIYNGESFKRIEILILLWFELLVVIVANVIDFFADYSSSTAYTAHLFGFVAGFVVGIAIKKVYTYARWKACLKALGIASSVALIAYLLYHYTAVWPPEAGYDYCCSSLLNDQKYTAGCKV